MKDRGARAHPRSGAGSIKEDGSDDTFLYEVKDTARKQFPLKAADLRTSFVRACQQGRQSVWLIHFASENFTAEVRLIPGGRELIQADPGTY